MRLNSSQFQQHARGKGGAVLDGDGELILPAVVQPTIILPAVFPAQNFAAPVSASQQERRLRVSANAALVALDQDYSLLTAGVWRIRLNVSFRAQIATPLVDEWQINLFDPGGISFTSVVAYPGMTTTGIITAVVLDDIYSFADAGWFFRMTTPATVLGNSVHFSGSMYYQKIL